MSHLLTRIPTRFMARPFILVRPSYSNLLSMRPYSQGRSGKGPSSPESDAEQDELKNMFFVKYPRGFYGQVRKVLGLKPMMRIELDNLTEKNYEEYKAFRDMAAKKYFAKYELAKETVSKMFQGQQKKEMLEHLEQGKLQSDRILLFMDKKLKEYEATHNISSETSASGASASEASSGPFSSSKNKTKNENEELFRSQRLEEEQEDNEKLEFMMNKNNSLVNRLLARFFGITIDKAEVHIGRRKFEFKFGKKSETDPELEESESPIDNANKERGRKGATSSSSSSGSKESKSNKKSDEGFWNAPGGMSNYLPTILLSLLISYMAGSSILKNVQMAMAPIEISFQEFLDSEYFKNGHVQKCVVNADKTMVHVYLKPTAPVFHGTSGASVTTSTYDDGTGEDSSSSLSSSDRLKNRKLPSPDSPFGHYVFTIGSLESFENTMNAAQVELERLRSASSLLSSSSSATMASTSLSSSTLSLSTIPKIPIIYEKPDSPSAMSGVFDILGTLIPFIILFGLLRAGTGLFGGGSRGLPGGGGGLGGGGGPFSNIFNVGKSKAKLYNAETAVKTTFKDVAGMEEAKEEVVEFVKFLKEPQVYEALGAKIPKGAILSGPPGTGKTLLAKAIAGEAGVPFLSVSGSEFVEMFVGVGASRVRDLFTEAKRLSPCIVFIDEIDAIGRSRGRSNVGGGGNDERESTLNQLLVEMDGFDSDAHVVVLAGTNRPDVLDAALTRPGRFDRHVSIDRPDVNGRKDIYMVHLKPIKLDPNGPSIHSLATKMAYMTPGFAGADIANVCNESALIAARRGAVYVAEVHLEAAMERVITGIEKKSRVLSMEEKNIVAHHEAGHATAAWFLKHADPVMKVTIIPRTSGALGFARTLPSDAVLMSREQLMDRLCVTLGGRVAEELFFGDFTSGAQNDLQKVTQWAYDSISHLGMDDSIGPLSFTPDESRGYPEKRYSEATAQLIDERARRLIMSAHAKTTELLKQNQEAMKRLALLLLEKETLHREDIERVLGPRPFPLKHAYDQYMERNKSAQATAALANDASKPSVVIPIIQINRSENEYK